MAKRQPQRAFHHDPVICCGSIRSTRPSRALTRSLSAPNSSRRWAASAARVAAIASVRASGRRCRRAPRAHLSRTGCRPGAGRGSAHRRRQTRRYGPEVPPAACHWPRLLRRRAGRYCAPITLPLMSTAPQNARTPCSMRLSATSAMRSGVAVSRRAENALEPNARYGCKADLRSGQSPASAPAI